MDTTYYSYPGQAYTEKAWKEYDKSMQKLFRDPVIKTLATNPVVCLAGHVNELGVLMIGVKTDGYARCNHQLCKGRIENLVINEQYAIGLRNWYLLRGSQFELSNMTLLQAEVTSRTEHLRKGIEEAIAAEQIPQQVQAPPNVRVNAQAQQVLELRNIMLQSASYFLLFGLICYINLPREYER